MALGQYKIKVVPVLDTASLHNQLEQAGVKGGKVGKIGTAGGEAYANGFTRALKERFKYSIANALIYGTQNAVKDMVNNVRELDKAQTEFKKVSDLTGESLARYTEQAYKTGAAVAKTGTEIVQAATEFRKSGFNDSDSLKLAKVASMYQNVADAEITAGEAANFIVSQMKAYNMTANDAEHIIDAVNEVSNKFAVSSADIATNIGKASAAMATGNVTYEQSIGLMTGMVEITRSGTKAARGLVTIQSRFNQIVDDSSSTGKKLLAFYTEHGIAVKDNEGQLRSFYDVASDLSKVWDTLSENEKRYYLNTQAGANQSQNLAALMRNFNTVMEATETAYNSTGSAAKENAKYLDSIEGKMQAFRSAWEQLSYHLVDSSTIKSLVDIGTTLIKVLDKIVEAVGKLPKPLSTVVGLIMALSTALGGLKLLQFAESFTAIGKAAKGLSGAVEGVGEAANVASGAKGIGALKTALGALTNPAVLAGLAALAVAIAAIEYDKYFSFDSSLKRLDKYKGELQSVTSEIEALKAKRDSDEGLTNAEKTHLAVLEAEERSLERQIALEKERVQAAFTADINTKQGKKYQERTGPTQLLDYQDARKAELALYDKIANKQKMISDAEAKLQKAREDGDKKMVDRYQNVLGVYNKELKKLDSQQSKLTADTAKSAAELAKYWQEVSANVDYSALGKADKAKFNELHRAFIESQIDANNLKDSYEDVSTTLNNVLNAFSGKSLNIFDDLDVSSFSTVDDVISGIQQHIAELDDDTTIKFTATDDTGQVLGKIEGKKSELTDEQWAVLIEAQATGDWSKFDEVTKRDEYSSVVKFSEEGIEAINKKANDASKNRTSVTKVLENGASQVKSVIDNASKDQTATVKVKETGASSVRSTINALAKPVTTVINIVKKVTTQNNATGKRKGEPGGMAWLGDEGSSQNPKPELVVGEDGAYLAGTKGWELYPVKSSDTVYTYAQTKKLLSGKQTFSGVASELPRFKKGKKKKATKSTPATNANVNKAQQKVNKAKNKKAKEKAKKALEKLQKQRETKRNEFDSKVAQLKHNAKVNHWTDAQYQAEYTNLYNQYSAYLSGDQSNTYTEDHDEYLDTLAKDESERLIGLVGVGGMSAASAVSSINANAHLTEDEKRDYRAKAYQESVSYNLKEYQNGKNTRQQILNDIQNYYNTRGKYDETYYEMVDKLRQADKEKELKRLSELEKKEENKLSYIKKYAQRQKEYYDEQVKKEKEEAEALEELVELQDKLNNAKKTMIKVYKEGEGFVYEQDTQAIREAQKALEDYNKEQQKSDLEQKAEAWQKIIDAIGEAEDLSEMKELELALGITNISQITGNIGLDANKWGNLAKTILATQMGLEDISKILSEAEGADIEKLIGATLSAGNKQVSNSLLSQYFAKHSFASGTLSSPSGFSIVGEGGPELRYLSKGSAIFSNGISRNLMEWGQYSPAQVLSNVLGGTQSQVFNFDKIVLPNVHNADKFYKELQALPNRAIQQSTFRM